MKTRELENLGITRGLALKAAQQVCADAANAGWKKKELRRVLKDVVRRPDSFVDDPLLGQLAAQLVTRRPAQDKYALRGDVSYPVWGADIDPNAHKQMANACSLPVTVAGALMPDAHVGYGLPIGGVLATSGAVIPYAVGVDIACRVKMTIFDIPPEQLTENPRRFESILERETLFGIGKGWRQPPTHAVMDENWGTTPITRQVKDLAWKQLGTSGSGNHFVEFGVIELRENPLGVDPGCYVAVVSHSGSRGAGSKVCSYYSRIARELHSNLPKELSHLAWLPLDGDGGEYWEAMELMGKYAAANHDIVHRKIARAVGDPVLQQVENHHNYAWKERHDGREVVVHRKGATPAGKGVIGYIPGSMTAPGYLVEGLGDPRSLDSASHGAGRRMSRKKAIETTRWSHLNAYLREKGVKLLSAGLDESPHAYKDIEQVMDAQSELVRRLARFTPRIVKMAPAGERPED